LLGVLLPLVKEGASVQGDSTECSKPVQTFIKQLPELVKTYITTLSNCPATLLANQEFGLRILHVYVTIASLIRPVTEQSRLRMARDMGAIEACLAASGISPPVGADRNPVILEFR
jgi:hypothetical protein